VTARLFTALGLAVLFAFAVIRVSRPPSPVPASAPATSFSAERAMRHVRAIAERPHPMGSVDHDRVRDYVITELTALGLTPQVQRTTAVGTRYQEAGRVQNILTRLPGREAGGQAVLLMAHYDGVEAGPAAGDDAAGSAAILETLRALRAGPPLTHDVIALFTDGEEAGLLGAAAFVREHPWIKDVGVALNFEARGTSGRSFMFETGPRNLDVARVLRGAPSVTAGSDFTTIYRTLPNDTDLSELAAADVPALNFAFADGVDRYHTTHDDVAHLNPGSLQHHGVQMLALARAFGNGSLPRPRTGDGVFFTLPGVGLVVYPEGWAIPLAVIAALLVVIGVVRVVRSEPRSWIGLVFGALAVIVSIVVSGALAYAAGIVLERVHGLLPWGGSPAWSGVHWAGVALIAFAVVASAYTFLRRRATARQLHVGALIIVALISLAVAARAPGMSYLFAWPLIAAALPELVSEESTVSGVRVRLILAWVAAFFATSFLVPNAYAIGAVMLGVTGTGGLVSVVLVTLIAWLLSPLVETLTSGARWSTSTALSLAALGMFLIGLLTVRSSDAHPEPSRLAYVMDAAPLPTAGSPGGPQAWLTSPAAMARTNAWARDVMSGSTRPPEWVARAAGRTAVGKAVTPLPLEGPTATILADSTAGGRRFLRLRVGAAPRTTAINMRITGAPVYSTLIDGRVMDTTRFRRRTSDWVLQYWAPSDSGAVIELTLPAGARPALELTARIDGLPQFPGMTIPARPQSVVPVQTGDVTMTYRRVPLG
jgi:hypothetical protein